MINYYYYYYIFSEREPPSQLHPCTHLSRTDETRCDHLGYHVHKVLGLLYDVVHFGEGGGLAHCWIFHCELQLLNVGRDLVQVLHQFFLMGACRNLCE